jgi:hypothetical protein
VDGVAFAAVAVADGHGIGEVETVSQRSVMAD